MYIAVAGAYVSVFNEPEGAARQLEQDDVFVAALCRLRTMSQHVRRVSLQRILARLLSRLLPHVPRRRHLHTRLSTGIHLDFIDLSRADPIIRHARLLTG